MTSVSLCFKTFSVSVLRSIEKLGWISSLKAQRWANLEGNATERRMRDQVFRRKSEIIFGTCDVRMYAAQQASRSPLVSFDVNSH